MPINIVCKKCGHKKRMIDIPWIIKGNFSKKNEIVICENCGRTLIKYTK